MGRTRGGGADPALGPVSTNHRVGHNIERPMQYEYSNEPEEEEDGDADAEDAERSYVNELILQRSRNRHPAPGVSDDVGETTISIAPTPGE